MKMKIKILLLAGALLPLLRPFPAPAGAESDPGLIQWRDYAVSQESVTLKKWMMEVMRGDLQGNREPLPFKGTAPEFHGRFGLFVTIIKGKKVRGCFGSFYPHSGSIELILRDYIRGALRRDHRYTPPDISEAESLNIILTIAARPYPLDNLWAVNLRETGIVLTCGPGDKIVYVPAEIGSLSIIEKSAADMECQIEAFRAVTLSTGNSK